MKLEKYYYWKKITFNRDPGHYGDKFIQTSMNAEIERGTFDLEQAYEEWNIAHPDETPIILRDDEAYLFIDGDFGKRTSAAVEYFQKYNKITIDGIVGPETFDGLMKDNFKLLQIVQLDWMRNA